MTNIAIRVNGTLHGGEFFKEKPPVGKLIKDRAPLS